MSAIGDAFAALLELLKLKNRADEKKAEQEKQVIEKAPLPRREVPKEKEK